MDALNVLFWNIGGNDLSKSICYYAHKYDIDVIVLIEDKIPPARLLSDINMRITRYFLCCSNDRRITIYTSFDRTIANRHVTRSKYISLVEFKFLTKQILFGGIHLPSKLNPISDAQRIYVSRAIRREIEQVEARLGHSNTIIVGDFNMNPFEIGMVEPESFNSVMTKQIASNLTRTVFGTGIGRGENYQYFYNPMWSFMGDLSKFSPGTYYFYENTFENHYRWNMLDQILMRPSLISNFVSDSLKIIETDEVGLILINDKRKSKSRNPTCDHLPVAFSMDLTK